MAPPMLRTAEAVCVRTIPGRVRHPRRSLSGRRSLLAGALETPARAEGQVRARKPVSRVLRRPVISPPPRTAMLRLQLVEHGEEILHRQALEAWKNGLSREPERLLFPHASADARAA